ncbi:MAG: GcvT family protein [Anaerolineales bacterium]|uniref:GcvT family protein n=1 Tax=Candidatus Desulfolinea nitratireducens TaxID=2841698 RepID=A0A8J6NGQ8_9CHLR|nr:GcvT family protein [Candidatus Desulfolinea nitratireducens]MBL6960373.1 GcvT family protein [Anaerolineales bacterium]
MSKNQSQPNSSSKLPSHAQVVIVGGGVIGCSVAYHLTKLGWDDVVLLERKELTSGTTWHAAGLVVTPSGDELSVEISTYTRELMKTLEAETGQSTGFRDIGYLQLATDPEWLEERRRMAVAARRLGVNYQEISPTEVKKMWPLAETSDILAGFYTAEDGRANPVDFTMALAKGARMGGVKIFEDTEVTGINKENGRVTGVLTDKGEIEAEIVVNCAGLWGRQLGKMAGVNVPLQAAEHYYLLTQPMEGVHADLPIIEDFGAYSYFREEVGGLLVGFFEPIAAPWGMDGIPKNFAFGEINPDWDRMMPYVEIAMERVPSLKDAGIHKFFCGPESFTPDGGPIMGESPELKNFFVAAGLNSLGILQGGGVGKIMAQWIVDGYCPVDSLHIDIARCLPFQGNQKFLVDRTVETLGLQYQLIWPNFANKSARNVRKTAIHEQLAKAGAFFIEGMGWEIPDWYAPAGVEAKVEKYSWKRQNWFEYLAEEHKACREDVIFMDVTSMSKFLVQGRDAEKVLNNICANDVAVPVGRVVYTQWLNERGGMLADLTVTRIAEDQFFIVSAGDFYTHDLMWLKKHIPDGAHAFVTDMTSAYTLMNIQGPKSRDLMQKITSVDVSKEAFPYMTSQNIDLNYALAQVMRVTYEGELGFELYVPAEFSAHVYESVVEAGQGLGLRHAGFQALNSLRIEKAYREYGHDMDNMDTPLEAGLGFAVKFDKPNGFIGRDALLRHKERGPLKYRMVQFLLEDPEPLLYGNEIIYRDGEIVGYLQTGTYGFTLGGAMGMGFVENEEGATNDFINSGKYEIDIAGERFPAKASLRPMYDPKGTRVRS